jgi:hypothetical protein
MLHWIHSQLYLLILVHEIGDGLVTFNFLHSVMRARNSHTRIRWIRFCCHLEWSSEIRNKYGSEIKKIVLWKMIPQHCSSMHSMINFHSDGDNRWLVGAGHNCTRKREHRYQLCIKIYLLATNEKYGELEISWGCVRIIDKTVPITLLKVKTIIILRM